MISEKRPMSTASRPVVAHHDVVGQQHSDVDGPAAEAWPKTKRPSVVQRSTRLTDQVDSVSSMMLQSAAPTVGLVPPATAKRNVKGPRASWE